MNENKKKERLKEKKKGQMKNDKNERKVSYYERKNEKRKKD